MKYIIIITLIIFAIIIVNIAMAWFKERSVTGDFWTWDGRYIYYFNEGKRAKYLCNDFEQAKRIMKDSYYVGNYKK